MRIALAQTKPRSGDLEGNVEQIIRYIRTAKEDKADLIVFPETAITGYCCGSLFEQDEFVAYNKQLLEDVIAREVPDDMAAVIGFVDIKGRKKNGKLNITNSAAVIQGGEIKNVYDKILLANDNHHEDKKYFTPGSRVSLAEVEIGGKTIKIGTPICEDGWYMDHDRDIIQEMKQAGADIIASPSHSYFSYYKQALRRNLWGTQAWEKQVPLVTINAAGVGDIVKNIMIYDGGSMVFDKEGNQRAELKRFSEDYQLIEMDLESSMGESIKTKDFTNKYEEIYDALIFEQRELFSQIGIQNAQVHVSGGLDSAIIAALVADAMGPEHSIFITNPTEDNGDTTKRYAQRIADALGVKLWWNSTQEPYEATVDSHTKGFGEEPTLTGRACIQAVLRTAQGIGAYHTFKSGIVATGNHTEIVEGWSTFHDIGSIGVHAPIGDLTKTELYEFAKYINQRRGKEIIPKELYDGTTKPAAELADAQVDPLDYFVRSGIDAELIRNNKSINQLVGDYRNRSLTPEYFPKDFDGKSIYEHIDEKSFVKEVLEAYDNARRSVFKAAQAAPIVILNERSRGFSNRETIINHYKGWCNIQELKERFADKD